MLDPIRILANTRADCINNQFAWYVLARAYSYLRLTYPDKNITADEWKNYNGDLPSSVEKFYSQEHIPSYCLSK